MHGILYQLNSLSSINGSNRPGIIHRLDKDTSGLLIVAKTNEAHQILAKDISEHKVKDTIMIVYGSLVKQVEL